MGSTSYSGQLTKHGIDEDLCSARISASSKLEVWKSSGVVLRPPSGYFHHCFSQTPCQNGRAGRTGTPLGLVPTAVVLQNKFKIQTSKGKEQHQMSGHSHDHAIQLYSRSRVSASVDGSPTTSPRHDRPAKRDNCVWEAMFTSRRPVFAGTRARKACT